MFKRLTVNNTRCIEKTVTLKKFIALAMVNSSQQDVKTASKVSHFTRQSLGLVYLR